MVPKSAPAVVEDVEVEGVVLEVAEASAVVFMVVVVRPRFVLVLVHVLLGRE